MDRQRRLELQRCLARLADGDRAAFRAVFDLGWPPVRAIAARLLSDSADADDAAQLAFLKVLERCAEYQPARDALAWMAGIVSYECMTIRRKAHRRRELADDSLDALPDRAPNAETRALTDELEAAVLVVLGQLNPLDRETLLAAYRGERDPVAKPATFRKRLERALERLRAAWRDHGIG